jgi:hypothetical protein
MRLARLAVAGLGLGMLAGFAVALLRPRPRLLPADPDGSPATGIPTSQAAFDQYGPAPRDPLNPRPDPVVPGAGRTAPAGETDRQAPGSVI